MQCSISLIEEAERLYRSGEVNAAVLLLTNLLHTDSSNVDAMISLGQMMCELQKFETALALGKFVLTIEPNNSRAHSLIALALHQQGSTEQAMASLQKAIGANPQLADAFIERGNALRAVGRHEEALASYDRAIQYRFGSAAAHYERGKVLRYLGRPDEASESFELAIVFDPKLNDARMQMDELAQEVDREKRLRLAS